MKYFVTLAGYNLIRKFICLGIVILASGSLFSAFAVEDKRPGKILLARGDHRYPPYEFINENGLPDGYNVDVFKAVAKVMGLKADLELGPWDQVRRALEDGEIDVLIGMFHSKEREQLVDFSLPHLIIRHTIFIRKGTSIQAEADLSNKEIIVQRGDIMHDYAVARNLTQKLILVESQPEGLRLLSSGRHDCFLGVKLQGIITINKFKLTNIVTAGPPIVPRNYGFAIAKGNLQLLSELNEGLSIIENTGELDKIYDKWFGVADPRNLWASKVLKYAAWILIPLLLILLLSALWLLSLRKQVARKTSDLQHELSERLKAEKLLHKRESLLTATLESTQDGVLVVTGDGIIPQVNARFKEIWEVPDAILENKDDRILMEHLLEKVVNPDPFLNKIKELYGSSTTSQDFIYLKDGRILDRTSYPLIEDERESGRVWFFRDITERRRSEEILRVSEERFRTALDANPNPVVIYDTEIQVAFLNKAFTRVFGWTLEEKMGRKIDEYIPKESWPETQTMINRMRAGESIYHTETYRLSKQGERIPVIASGSAFTDRDGKPAGTIINLKDIREQKKLQAQLQQAQKMEAIGTLAGGIAHDFNNILATVIGYTELALDSVEKGSLLSNNLQAVFNAGIRAKDLVSQILTFSRQAGHERKPVQVNLIILEALKFLRASLPTSIEIQRGIHSDALVLADPTQINQVLMNLCTNAGHAMREKGGVLEVNLENIELESNFTDAYPDMKPGAYVELTISDSGEGMPPQILDRIFDPFFTTKETEGTGMGLSVVHGIVRDTGGTITVQSKPGQGSVFRVYLPIIERRLDTKIKSKEAATAGKERILFVDDEPALVRLGKQTLETLGYDVDTRSSSIEALELFRADPGRFDLVITDMTMPNMTGDDLAKELIKINPETPVVLCTGFSTRINKEQALSMGIRAFVTKPFLASELAGTIRKVLDEYRDAH